MTVMQGQDRRISADDFLRDIGVDLRGLGQSPNPVFGVGQDLGGQAVGGDLEHG